MAKILVGTVEVAPKCALPWQALLSYVRTDLFLQGVIDRGELPGAEAVASLMAGNIAAVDATKLEEYNTLLTRIRIKDKAGAISSLEQFRAKVVPLMIQDVVECECER